MAFEAITKKIEKLTKGRERILGPSKILFENGVVLETGVLEKSPEFRFVKDGGVLLEFSSLAPPGTKFIHSNVEKWGANPGRGRDEPPEIHIGRFEGADAVLSFLHEAGHLKNSEDLDIAETAKRFVCQERKKDVNNVYPESRLRAIKEERVVRTRIERDAWAYALRCARVIEKTCGIKIFDRLPSRGRPSEKARAFVNKYLETYEQGYLDELYDINIFSTKDMEKLFEALDVPHV